MSLKGVPRGKFQEKISLFLLASAIALLTGLAGVGERPAQAVDPQIISTAAVCTGAWGTGNTAYAGPATKIYAPSGATITSATVPYASASTKSSARISIYSSNGSLPGSQIGYFTFSSEASNVATFTGSPIILPSAGFYWVQLGATSSQMNCYTNTANYSGSNTGWLSYAGIAYGSAGSGYVPTTWAAFGSPQNAYQINFSLFGIETGSGSIALASLNSPAAFRVSTAITATTTGVGKATFFQNRKVIASCKNLSVSGSSVTCTWKPSTHGAVTIYAKYTPTGGTSIRSNSINVSVIRRSTAR